MVLFYNSSAFPDKISAALRAVHTDLSVPPGYTDLLSTARTLKDTVLSPLPKAELKLSEIFRYIEVVTHINLVFLVTFTHIPGKHPEVQGYDPCK